MYIKEKEKERGRDRGERDEVMRKRESLCNKRVNSDRHTTKYITTYQRHEILEY